MNETQSFFIKILSSYVNKEKLYVPDTVDWQQILYLSEIHNVQVMIYLVLKELDEKPPILDKLHQKFLMAVNIATLQEAYTEKVLSKFDEAGIEHTLFKGYIIRNYYPDKEARSFGDVDILISQEDRKKSDAIIKELGFNYDETNGYTRDVWTYTKDIVNLEIHTRVIYHKLFNDFDYIEYFDSKIKNKERISGLRYGLKKEDHFIYLLVHLAKHFYNTGAGIRMILDFAFFYNELGDKLDFYYIKKELEFIQIGKFSNIIFFICNDLFATNIDCKKISASDEEEIINYILGFGVFGFNNKNYYDVSFNRDSSSRLKLFLQKLFPEYEYMIKSFSWFENGKKYQLPYAWIRRILEQIIKKERRNLILTKSKAIIYPSNDACKHNDMLKVIGLK